MSELPCCPKCCIQLPADAPAGLCPKCLVKAGFESRPASASAEPGPGPTKLSPPASGFVPPTVDELAPLFPQWEILELLGKGGMGAVYKARQPKLDRLVAVKILPPEISLDPAFAERFQREARALARLSHPHIVAVYDFGETAGLCYIVMEFVNGANLRQTMQSGGLTPQAALAIVPQICEALQFAHDEGIVHRDIKPENILIDKKGQVKIADFGLAKMLVHDAPDHSLTATRQVMGTPRYMAPEQMEGTRDVDHRADIYSLGVVFYELLTGQLPMGKFAPPSKKVHVDVRLDEIVLRALEQEPKRRYQHASEVKTDVELVGRTPVAGLNADKAPQGGVFPIRFWERDSSEPRLSGHALYGASWAAVGLLAAALCVLGSFTTPTSVLGTYLHAPVRGFGLLALSAPFGTTILGAIAVATIKRSGGKLYGLRLAALDLLTFPLIVLGAVTAYVTNLLAFMIGFNARGPTSTSGVETFAVFGVLGMIVSLVVCFFVGRLAWSKIAGGPANNKSFGSKGGTPLAQMRFLVDEPCHITRQAIFHFSSLGYQLIEEQPDVCVFQRGGQWAGLCETDIRKIAMRLTVRTAPAAAGRLWVSCDWAVRTLGSWITRRDILQLEAEGEEFKTLLGVAVSPDSSSVDPLSASVSLPRIIHSRWTLWNAACLLTLSLVSVLLPSMHLGWLERRVEIDAIPVAGAEELRVAPRSLFEAGITLWEGQIIAGACVIALAIVGSVWFSQKSLAHVVALMVAGGVTLGVSAYYLAFATAHQSVSALSWHDFQSAIQGNSSAAESAVTRELIRENSAFIPLFKELNDELKFLSANVGLEKNGVESVPPSWTAQVRRMATPGAKWTLFFGVCTLILGISDLIRQITYRSSEVTVVTPSRPLVPEQISLGAAITGAILPIMILIGGILLSSHFSMPDSIVPVCFLMGMGLELVAIGCGFAARGTKSGRAGLIIGSVSLVLWLVTLSFITISNHEIERQPEPIITGFTDTSTTVDEPMAWNDSSLREERSQQVDSAVTSKPSEANIIRESPMPATPEKEQDLVRLERVGHIAVVGDDPFLGLAVQGQYAYLIQGNVEKPKRLQVVDLSDLSQPHIVGSTPVTVQAAHLAVAGKYVYVLDEPRLRVFDVSASAAPRDVSACELGATLWDVALHGRFAYVTDLASVRVIDLENPISPKQVGRCEIPDAQGITVVGQYAYIACDIEGLSVVDISNPNSPALIGRFNGPAGANAVAVVDNHAYIAGGEDAVTLWIADISNPKEPKSVSKYGDWIAGSVAVRNDVLYLAGGELDILDISQPAAPKKAGSYRDVGFVTIAGENVFVLGDAGFSILRVVLADQ